MASSVKNIFKGWIHRHLKFTSLTLMCCKYLTLSIWSDAAKASAAISSRFFFDEIAAKVAHKIGSCARRQRFNAFVHKSPSKILCNISHSRFTWIGYSVPELLNVMIEPSKFSKTMFFPSSLLKEKKIIQKSIEQCVREIEFLRDVKGHCC